MSWLQLTIRVSSPQDAEFISDGLLMLGAESITFQDAKDEPLYEPELNTTPLWDTVLVRGLFDEKTDLSQILEKLEKSFSTITWHYSIEYIAEENWQNKWKENFKSECFGQRLWIVPSWEIPPDPKGIILHLDPGLAFGTGTHPTTRLCLEWLAQHDLTDKTVVDYGCGSGILGLAALKLGTKHVTGVDIDPQALEATRANAERNNISFSQLMTSFPDDLSIVPVDIVIANILAKPLIELAPVLSKFCKLGGKIVLSGILIEQVPLVIDAYKPFARFENSITLDEWALIESCRDIF